MSKFTQDFSHIEFTQDEKAALAQRLQQAAEQEETMTDNTKKKVRNVSRGMVVGLAAARDPDGRRSGGRTEPHLGQAVLLPVLRGAGTAGKADL